MSQTTKQKYKARQGDIITLNLNPQAGREQNGRRPALVVSSDEHNDTTNGNVMVCPITNTKRGWPLHIHLKGTNKRRKKYWVQTTVMPYCVQNHPQKERLMICS